MLLLASAFAHLRLRFPFVSLTLHHSLLVASPEATSSLGPTVYIASCLVASSLRSPPLSSPSRRIALIPFPKMLLCRSRTSCAPGVTFDTVRVNRAVFYIFFYLKCFHPQRLIPSASPDYSLFFHKIKFARDLL